MSLSEDFVNDGVQVFMTAHTLSVPGVLSDGGTIDYSDPTYAAERGGADRINVANTPVRAAWRPGNRPRDARLVLEVSRDYKMVPTGRQAPVPGGGPGATTALKGSYENERKALRDQSLSGGLARNSQSAGGYANEGVRLSGQRVRTAEWFNCYFLPYSQGRRVCMQLGADADYFFTATMNGCSFLVSGDAHTPTVTHLNSTRPEDTLEGAVVTKADLQARYRDLTGDGDAGAALLSKYEGHAAFAGARGKYELSAEEIAGVNDPDLLPNARAAADLRCYVVGERTDERGWVFYYQRAAAMQTMTQVVTPSIRAVPKSLKHQLRKKFNMTYKVKPELVRQVDTRNVVSNHVVTPCATLAFNVLAQA